MALSKIQTGLVDTNAIGATELNLADNFAFTGDVTGAGTWVHIKTLSGTNVSSLDFLHGSNDVVFDDTYDVYEFIIHHAFNQGGGYSLHATPAQTSSTFSDSNTETTRSRTIFENGTASFNTGNNTNQGIMRTYLNLGTGAGNPIGGRVQVRMPWDTSYKTLCMYDNSGRDNSNYYREIGCGNLTTVGRTYGVRFRAESGNTTAKISLYGISYS